MIPTAWVVLPALPLTPNGKLDRQRLPAPDSNAFSHQIYEAPQGETEILLARLWAEVLKLESVGRHDNFFDLGGHSLRATQLLSRVRAAFRVDIPLRRLFEIPTLTGFAEYLETIRWTAEELPGSSVALGADRDEGVL
jgi:acyl carrier protein